MFLFYNDQVAQARKTTSLYNSVAYPYIFIEDIFVSVEEILCQRSIPPAGELQDSVALRDYRICLAIASLFHKQFVQIFQYMILVLIMFKMTITF